MLIWHSQTFHIVYFLAFSVIPIVSTVLLTHDTHRIVNNVPGGWGTVIAQLVSSRPPHRFFPSSAIMPVRFFN